VLGLERAQLPVAFERAVQAAMDAHERYKAEQGECPRAPSGRRANRASGQRAQEASDHKDLSQPHEPRVPGFKRCHPQAQALGLSLQEGLTLFSTRTARHARYDPSWRSGFGRNQAAHARPQ